MSAKMDVTHEAGKLHYVASGGRSPFEKIECSISWGAGGEGASTTAVVVARPGRFKDVKQAGQPEAEALRASLREVFTFDPMSLDEEQVRVPATDLNTYTLDMTLGASSRTVTGYGLVEGSEFAQLIRGMDEICGVSAAISEARGS